MLRSQYFSDPTTTTQPHYQQPPHPQQPMFVYPQQPMFVYPQQPMFVYPQQPMFVYLQQPMFVHPQQPMFVHPQQPMFVHPQQPMFVHPQQPMFVHPQQPMFVHPQQPMFVHPQQPMSVHPQQPMLENPQQRHAVTLSLNLLSQQPFPSNLEVSPTTPQTPQNNSDGDTETRRLTQRQKQINLGYVIDGYRRYRANYPPSTDVKTSTRPSTPDIQQNQSKRGWDKLVSEWKIKLHQYDTAAYPEGYEKDPEWPETQAKIDVAQAKEIEIQPSADNITSPTTEAPRYLVVNSHTFFNAPPKPHQDETLQSISTGIFNK